MCEKPLCLYLGTGMDIEKPRGYSVGREEEGKKRFAMENCYGEGAGKSEISR